MESTLFIAIRDSDSERVKQIVWMLGDSAPVFDEEVKPQWRGLFKALENLLPPDDVVLIGDNRLVLNWLCADPEEELKAVDIAFRAAGISRFAAYRWYDESEDLLLLHDGNYTLIDQTAGCGQKIKSLVSRSIKGWGTGRDREIICSLLEALE